TEHVVTLNGLFSDTLYYYAIGNSTGQLIGDSSHFFHTSPVTGSDNPVRFWVLGDCGTANANAAAVRDAYFGYAGSNYTNGILMLGDNAYNTGTDAEYQAAVFDMYDDLLKQSVLWPTPGNHDYGSGADAQTETGPYYDIFTLPRQAEAGGIASNTEAYYSFDVGNVHVISLDSHDSDRSPGGPMLTWLTNDLAATLQDWIIVIFHHPAYTKGSHDSDSNSDSGGRMVEMRENVLPILEDYDVDLVLSGHSHSFERSFLIDGHYGHSSTFDSTMVVNGGDGQEDGDGAYIKDVAVGLGSVYITAGSSGKISGGPLNHPVMYYSANTLGSVSVEVDGDQMDIKFISSTGTISDHLTILHESYLGAPPTVQLTSPVDDIWFAAPQVVTITASA
ncbi:MAG: metallophosphoesterase, partial [Saprospiraceae bacterium]|nr:metallophosphoesterase [Saprospiraceae bacterium]